MTTILLICDYMITLEFKGDIYTVAHNERVIDIATGDIMLFLFELTQEPGATLCKHGLRFSMAKIKTPG